jgi:hypothetical protein
VCTEMYLNGTHCAPYLVAASFLSVLVELSPAGVGVCSWLHPLSMYIWFIQPLMAVCIVPPGAFHKQSVWSFSSMCMRPLGRSESQAWTHCVQTAPNNVPQWTELALDHVLAGSYTNRLILHTPGGQCGNAGLTSLIALGVPKPWTFPLCACSASPLQAASPCVFEIQVPYSLLRSQFFPCSLVVFVLPLNAFPVSLDAQRQSLAQSADKPRVWM